MIHALLEMPCSSNIHVSHVSTSYGGFPLVQSLNIEVQASGNPSKTPPRLGEIVSLGGTSRNNVWYGFPYHVEYPMPKEPVATQLQWS